MSITDELREYADRLSDEAARKSEHGFSPVAMKLEGIADRIDAEHESACAEAYGNGVMSVPIALDESAWVELPKDADGVPIHVGDTVYGCRSGMKMTISELRMTADGWSISTSRGYLTDAEVTHTRPDSLESIADELEGLSVDSMASDTNLLTSCALDLAKRIRRLAEREG